MSTLEKLKSTSIELFELLKEELLSEEEFETVKSKLFFELVDCTGVNLRDRLQTIWAKSSVPMNRKKQESQFWKMLSVTYKLSSQHLKLLIIMQVEVVECIEPRTKVSIL